MAKALGETMPRNGDSKVMQPFKILCRLPMIIRKETIPVSSHYYSPE